MPLWSMAVFGSRARGDDDPKSDIDILLITSGKKPRLVNKDRLSFSLYPSKWLLKKAQAGDLFVFHLVREAKVIYDSRGDFARMCVAFQQKDSYELEIRQASTLGWFLYRYGAEFDSYNQINRRMAWCVRTILIARTAEAGEPVFSAAALSRFAKSRAVEQLIKNKSDDDLNPENFALFLGFLEEWGSADMHTAAPEAYLEEFRRSKNTIGIKTYYEAWNNVDAEYV